MGACCSKEAHRGFARGDGGPRRLRRANSALTTTGIMDEIAPETTAPKLDLDLPGVDNLVTRITDIIRGERWVINDRIPEIEQDARYQLYGQLMLLVRDVVHYLNEECDLGLSMQLPPSHVMDLVAAARIKADTIDDCPFRNPPPVRKGKVCRAISERRIYIETWLLVAGDDDLEPGWGPLGRYTRYCQAMKACLNFAAKPLEKEVNESALEVNEYLTLVKAGLELEKRRYASLLKSFMSCAVRGFVRADSQKALTTLFLTQEEVVARIKEDGIFLFQGAKWSYREYLHHITDTDKALETTSHDMTKSLHDYYIYTSANSWLSTKEQVTSGSSTESIRKVLESGCRVVQLECHEGVDGEPRVYLAWTKNKPLPLKECLNVIKDHAFTNSPYPVILSLRLHYGLQSDAGEQMSSTARYVKEAFGSMLGRWGDEGDPPEEHSPEALKGKILVETEKRWQEISHNEWRIVRSCPSPLVQPAADMPPQLKVNLGLHLVNVKSRTAVKIKRVEEGTPADQAGLTEGSFIEEVLPKNGLACVKVSSVEDLMKVLLPFRYGDEIRLRVDQRDAKIVLTHPTPCSPTLGHFPAFEDPNELPPLPTETSVVMSDSVTGHEFAFDSSDEDRPEILRKAKKLEIASKFNAGHRYKKLPVNKSVSEIAFLRSGKKRHRSSVSGDKRFNVAWWQSESIPSDSVAQIAAEQDPKEREAMLEATESHLTHVVPPSSLTSENCNPASAWGLGCQMVAVNFHNPDEYYRMHRAQFSDNGGCGYLLKPAHLRSQPAPPPQPLRLKVRVHLVAWFVPHPPDPTQSDSQVPQIQTNHSQQRHESSASASPSMKRDMQDDPEAYCVAVSVNGYSTTKSEPSVLSCWEYETEHDVACRDADVLCISIFEHPSGRLAADTAVPIRLLRPGPRSHPLFDPRASAPLEAASVLCTAEFVGKVDGNAC